MIIALDPDCFDSFLEYPRTELANHHETPMEQELPDLRSLGNSSLAVDQTYTRRLSMLGGSDSDQLSSCSESLQRGSTIPINETSWPLNGRNDSARFDAPISLRHDSKRASRIKDGRIINGYQ